MPAPFPKDILSLQFVFCTPTLLPTVLLEVLDFFSKYSSQWLWFLLLLFERVSNPWSLRAFSTQIFLFAHTESGALNECPARLRRGAVAQVYMRILDLVLSADLWQSPLLWGFPTTPFSIKYFTFGGFCWITLGVAAWRPWREGRIRKLMLFKNNCS